MKFVQGFFIAVQPVRTDDVIRSCETADGTMAKFKQMPGCQISAIKMIGNNSRRVETGSNLVRCNQRDSRLLDLLVDTNTDSFRCFSGLDINNTV